MDDLLGLNSPEAEASSVKLTLHPYALDILVSSIRLGQVLINAESPRGESEALVVGPEDSRTPFRGIILRWSPASFSIEPPQVVGKVLDGQGFKL
ncbi:hypothetical protein ACGFJ7_34815 [Actinoplanes sp. NPDC048988]|uniref:hypothetical protein n=1 Tax=Actinoplanes sp. NPDC048988 TaxID=3363901 RepID=UPI003713F33C